MSYTNILYFFFFEMVEVDLFRPTNGWARTLSNADTGEVLFTNPKHPGLTLIVDCKGNFMVKNHDQTVQPKTEIGYINTYLDKLKAQKK